MGYQSLNIQAQQLSVRVEKPVTLAATCRTLLRMPSATKPEQKTILQDITFQLSGPGLTAIVGSSGSGKTTLLNTLSGRSVQGRIKHSGNMSITSEDVTYSAGGLERQRVIPYVKQEDLLLPTLTVRETLQFAADLRLFPVTRKERRLAVEKVITEFGLSGCADTLVGDTTRKGCSGGEKRRTSIAVELLRDEPMIFLDEPTTGLDPRSALEVVTTLNTLARHGKTVIMTIHQPRSEMWELLDNLMIMSRGSLLYSGPVDSCLAHFEGAGYPLPTFTNPFDHLIDTVTLDTRTNAKEEASSARISDLRQLWLHKITFSGGDLDDKTTAESSTQSHSRCTPPEGHSMIRLGHQTAVHVRRATVIACRDRLGVLAAFIEAACVGLICGLVFFRLGRDLAGIRSREGGLYVGSVMQGYLVLILETFRLSAEIKNYDKERAEGVITPFAFVVSRRCSKLLIEDIPVPLLFSLVFYFAADFRQEASSFFVFLAIQFLVHQISVTIAMICVAVDRDFMKASLIANLNFTLQCLCAGFILNSRNTSVWIRWMKWLSYVYYAFGALCSNEFHNNFYDCPSAGGAADPACKEYTGAFILTSLSFPRNWLARPIGALCGFLVLLPILATILLYSSPSQIRAIRTEPGQHDWSDDVGNSESEIKSRPIEVKLRSLNVGVKRSKLVAKATTKPIVQSVSADFVPGAINIIMGPSGSGKSTLLSVMAARFQSSVASTYSVTGDVLFNGRSVLAADVPSICSYVCQDDVGLLPYLTVQETLRYAAQLRLPAWMTQSQKTRRADAVLRELGLKSCADTAVGGPWTRGISGGERRRVSIAIQMLTNPSVLLLDEPTSGLDACTAASILKALTNLANENRTVIMAVHQPRWTFFEHVDNVLVLGRSGEVAYMGSPRLMLNEFQETYKQACPERTNPADFALDMVSQHSPLSHQVHKADEVSVTTMLYLQRESEEKHLLPASLGLYRREVVDFRRALPVMLNRSLTNMRRSPNLLLGRLVQIAGVAFVLLLFFTPLRNDYFAVQTRMGYLSQTSCLIFVGMLNAIAMYPAERDLFVSEQRDRATSLGAFFIAYTAIEIPAEILGSFIFSALAVFAVGLPRTASLFFLMTYTTFCMVSCGESLTIMFLTAVFHPVLAISLMTVVLSLAANLNGVFSLNMMHWLQDLNSLNPVKWTVGANAAMGMRGVQFVCTAAEKLPNGTCPIETGEQVLKLYNLDISVAKYAAALAGLTIGYRVLTYLVLLFNTEGSMSVKQGFYKARLSSGEKLRA